MEHRRRSRSYDDSIHGGSKRARAQEPTKKMKGFSHVQTDVSLTLAKHVLSKKKFRKGNIVFSLVSIHVVLGILAIASGAESLDGILSYLKSKSSEEFNSLISQLMSTLFEDGSALGGPVLSFANGMWIDQAVKLKESFEQVVSSAYEAGIGSVDFRHKADEVRVEINNWAEKETNGLIKDLLQPGQVHPLTRLIFANAVYFKGKWEKIFDVSDTRDHNFFLPKGKVVQAPFITSGAYQQVRAFDGFKVLRLAYKKGKDMREYSMYFYLPDEKDGLASLTERFGFESAFIDNHLPVKHVKVGDFRFPKFKINFNFAACKVLNKMGLASAICGPLTEIAYPTEGEDLVVSSILQKAFIEVNEEGTKAAAVTFSCIRPGASAYRPRKRRLTSLPIIRSSLFSGRHSWNGVIRGPSGEPSCEVVR